ncbi:response regulator transcription factor [Alkalihalobacillus pseudalcaliphilus]|uniref:response regulator transcription factor n=1 Tax=Alkalihalobacillus pseudalcaliphilus TaxID=79884 RepID=UPI00064DE6EF|nr:response regulator transcription factor [Alkalihalobacillus pseudalcaliphilus]KMK76514.1 transcriptional regulator [Alkalihalobacillus pseudalcaliphilus]
MDKILVVEDEMAISQVLKVYLKNSGYDIKQVFDGKDVLQVFADFQPDLVLLDVMLPNQNGWTLLKEIRQISMCPVIMLTALDDVQDKLQGLHDGADDYITKPFIGDEVVARVQAVLRRASSAKTNLKTSFGDLMIDYKAHRMYLFDEEVELTPKDRALLLFLTKHPNQTFTREQLLDQVWGFDYEGSDRAVDLAIKRIRKALKNWPKNQGDIYTLRGLGYQLRVEKQGT